MDTCDTTTGACAHAAAVSPVTVAASVDGNAVPGATLTATAAVTVCDGSTVQSYAWTQSNSVVVTISGATTASAGVSLPNVGAYKDELLKTLTSPPISADQLPDNVPAPADPFPGGLQNRFEIVGISNFTLEEAGLVTLKVEVTTSSGTYSGDVAIHAELPWVVNPGIRNVPVGVPLLLHGKTQDTYDWSMSKPSGSTATLTDATTQNPYFTPDVAGKYTLTVTDNTVDPAAPVTIEVFAGMWTGAITGQDADGRPVAANCTICHNGSIAPDKFTPWAQTGHAEIFTNNINTSTHYSTACFQCHTVGYNTTAVNGGMDDATDYSAFLTEFSTDGVNFHAAADNWERILADTPKTAQLTNIQCENCHGPQNSAAHTTTNQPGSPPRISLSADVCGSCHGEPLRHGRFQQWQLSGHANYTLATEEGLNPNCARCHTVNGFLAWADILQDNDPITAVAVLDSGAITWTTDEIHPQTCVTCHDPHSVGTTTGIETDATMRISGNTPPLIAGFTATDVGRGAICMTCHNSRRGLRNDAVFADTPEADLSRAPHGPAQADVLMGQNAYLVEIGNRSPHSVNADVEDTCVNCHMKQTPPPDLLSYQLGGTNHTFFASTTICEKCHGTAITADMIQGPFDTKSTELKGLIETALLNLITEKINAGDTIDLIGPDPDNIILATITSAVDVVSVVFGDTSGRQALTVNFADGTSVGPVGMNKIKVLDGAGADLGDLYSFASDGLVKAGWNYLMGKNDQSKGVHHPTFVAGFLQAAIDALATP